MKILYLATTNQEKLREFREILDLEIKQIKVEISEIQAVNIEEVIEHKAREAYRKTKKEVLVEDSGIGFRAWRGLPGALYKWFYCSVGNKGICKMMKTEKNRVASAITVVAYYDGQKVHSFRGIVDGKIVDSPRGKHGFGYDEIFVPQGYKKTFAQMKPEEKNKISMRKIALGKLKEYLKK